MTKTIKAAKLSPPWDTFLHKIEAIFNGDSEVSMEYDEEEKYLKINVSNVTKAEALRKIIPGKKDFGNVVMKIDIVSPEETKQSAEEILKQAFNGNPNVTNIVTTPLTSLSFGATYVVFKKEVVQFFNDDLQDLNGLCSTLFEDIAREVFDVSGDVAFCTDSNTNTATASSQVIKTTMVQPKKA